MSQAFITNNIKNGSTGEVIDVSHLGMFEAAKSIIMISTKNFSKHPAKKLKYKVSTPNIQNLLNDLPIANMIEII